MTACRFPLKLSMRPSIVFIWSLMERRVDISLCMKGAKALSFSSVPESKKLAEVSEYIVCFILSLLVLVLVLVVLLVVVVVLVLGLGFGFALPPLDWGLATTPSPSPPPPPPLAALSYLEATPAERGGLPCPPELEALPRAEPWLVLGRRGRPGPPLRAFPPPGENMPVGAASPPALPSAVPGRSRGRDAVAVMGRSPPLVTGLGGGMPPLPPLLSPLLPGVGARS
jgi:hypothetical protein